MNKEETEKLIDRLFHGIIHSNIIWKEDKWHTVSGTFYTENAGNEQLLPLVALYDIIVLPIWSKYLTPEEKEIIEELDENREVILIELNDKA